VTQNPGNACAATIARHPSATWGEGPIEEPTLGVGRFRELVGSVEPLAKLITAFASQVGTKRRPMTGSAKQSILSFLLRDGLLRRKGSSQ
jgi:hypothetical protein